MTTGKGLCRVYAAVMLCVLMIFTGPALRVRAQEVPAAGKPGRGWYWTFLDKKEQRVYDALLGANLRGEDTAAFSEVPRTSFLNAWDALRLDHPEFFWLEGGEMWTTSRDLVWGARFDIDPEGHEKGVQLCLLADQIIASAPAPLVSPEGHSEKTAADYELARFLYEAVIDAAVYTLPDEDERAATIEGVFYAGKGSCLGYSRAFKFLCDRAGIPSIIVLGMSLEDGRFSGYHAWNMLFLDGGAYWVDVTWGERADKAEGFGDAVQFDYDYFCATDESFLQSHLPDPSLGGDLSDPERIFVTYPACGDDSLSYGRLFGGHVQDGEEAVDYLLARLNQGADVIRMEFEDRGAYEETLQFFREEDVVPWAVRVTGAPFTGYVLLDNGDAMTMTVVLRR